MLHARGGQDLLEHALHQVHDVGFLNEGHLDVDLRELRLTVGAQVLVAEAAGDLVVALDAADHEHLLELLRGLRQRVELARVRTGGHQVVASALGRGVGQDGRFHLDEAALVQRGAHGLGHGVAQAQGLVHLRTAKVHVAPLHARGLVGLDAVLDGERRGDGFVKHVDLAGQHLDLAGGHVRVHGVGAAVANRAGDLQGVLATQMLCLVEVLLGHAIGVDDHLGVAGAIAQVAEDQPAVIAVVPRPTAQRDLAAHVGLAQLAARCVVHAKLVDVIRHSLLLLAMLYGRPAASAGPGCCSNLAIVHHERSRKPYWLPAPLKMPWLQRRGVNRGRRCVHRKRLRNDQEMIG